MRLYVPLSKPEIDALVETAIAQRRRPQEQAAVLLTKTLAELTRRADQGDSVPMSKRSIAGGREVPDEA